MTDETNEFIRQHYEMAGGDIGLAAKVAQLLAAVPAGDGGRIGTGQLAAFDQLHIRGQAATAQLAALAQVGRGTKLLDAGSGLGGPSRFLAEAYGCEVIGIDLTPSFVEVARLLTERTGLDALASYRAGDLTDLPFVEANFDMVWTQHVVMNIPDRLRVYKEFARVLRPDGKFVFYDPIAADDKPQPHFPVPWAENEATSFLLNKAETVAALESAGFAVSTWNDVTGEALQWLDEPPRPAPFGLGLPAIFGPRFGQMMANFARNVREGRVRLAMGVCDLR